MREVEELSLGDRRQQLEVQTTSFEHICGNIEHTRARLDGEEEKGWVWGGGGYNEIEVWGGGGIMR